MKINITANGNGKASVKLSYRNKTYVEHWEDLGQDGLRCDDGIEKQLEESNIEDSEAESIVEMLDNIDIGDIIEKSYMEVEE